MQTLSDRLDALEGHYHLHFAGRPRATRDPAMLGAMLDALGLAEPSAEGARIAQLEHAWKQERAQIEAAQTRLTPRGVIAARTLERVARACARLSRLMACAAPERLTHAELAALSCDLDEAQAHLIAMKWPEEVDDVLRGEHGRQSEAVAHARRTLADRQQQLSRARREGTLQTQAAHLVGAAERVLARCRAQTEERPQHVIRPQLLVTLADALEELATALGATRPPHVAQGPHETNCRALAAQAGHWRVQAEKARGMRRQQSIGDMATALLDEADAILEAAENSPADATLAAMVAMRMDEVLRQLEELPTAFGLGNHAQATLGIADCLAHLDGRLAHAMPHSGAA